MDRILLLFAAAALAACAGQGRDRAETAPGVEAGRPELGRNTAIYEVVDERSRARLAFVERTEYDSGRVVLWVRDLPRRRSLGYIDSNGRGYRFRWVNGRREQEPESLGADLVAFNVRRILGYERAVELVETSEKRLGDELLAKMRKAEAAPAAPAAGDAEGAGGTEESAGGSN